MPFLLSFILIALGTFIFIQYRKHNKANQLYKQARELEKKDTRSPDDITKLNQALTLYKQCSKLVDHSTYIKAANQCQKKIDARQRFQNLLVFGRKNSKQGFFKEALSEFLKAKKLFVTKELEDEISKCQESIKQQEKYENVLGQSSEIARQGEFQEAINLLKPALDEFSREDGQQLLAKLERIIQAKKLYKLGLIAENTGKLNEAKAKYEKTLKILPEFVECKIRLALVDVKNKNYNKAISDLETIEGKRAAYIRGFAHAQLGNWQQANREWRSIDNDAINSQREILKSLAERDRLFRIKEIESTVDNNNVEIAKILSLEFIKKFSSEPTIQNNLENHIQPLLERQIWKTQNWQEITAKTEQIWLEQQNIKSLHNWAVASYYLSQTDSSKLANFIIAWSTALANIEQNPVLKNVPWLGSNSIDIKDVSAKLKQILENAIDAVKDNDINEYLKLRDIYRREMVTLSLVQKNGYGMKIKQQLVILPGCYQRFRDRLPIIKFPAEVWGALYTDWGTAVAACLERDTARAIKIKPFKNLSLEVDRFASYFVFYHEGCHYLQNLEWRGAIKPLQQAKSEIKAKFNWCKEIDRLCELQRKKINELDEHLQFSKFWYELIASQSAKSYFAERKAIQVGTKIDDKKISLRQGLDELQTILNIDPNNSFTLNLIEAIEIDLELQEINRLWKQSQYEELVRLAKRSHHEQVRFKVAEVCLEVILQQLQNGNLSYETIQGLNKIFQWAYELCPYEPTFQPIYSQLRAIGIH